MDPFIQFGGGERYSSGRAVRIDGLSFDPRPASASQLDPVLVG